jgi:hypothetical protein
MSGIYHKPPTLSIAMKMIITTAHAHKTNARNAAAVYCLHWKYKGVQYLARHVLAIINAIVAITKGLSSAGGVSDEYLKYKKYPATNNDFKRNQTIGKISESTCGILGCAFKYFSYSFRFFSVIGLGSQKTKTIHVIK